jgi:hypothetical protein
MPDRTLTMVFGSHGLFRTAVRAYERSTEEMEPPRDNALISIIFAAATVEAMINELTASASAFLKTRSYANETVRTFVDLENELEESKASVKSKVNMAKWVLSGTSFDKGAAVYQDFAALMDLRNELVHMKGLTGDMPFEQWPEFREPKAISHLRAKNVLTTPDAEDERFWTEMIRNPKCALWACRTSATIVLELVSHFPQDHDFWTVIKAAYEEEFGAFLKESSTR